MLFDFSSTDNSLISISSISAMGFGLPNLLAPRQAKDLNWEAGVSADDTIVRFMGHGITSGGVAIGALNGFQGEERKNVLKGLSVLHATVAMMVGDATRSKELKQPVGIANVVLHSALAVACGVRGFAKDA